MTITSWDTSRDEARFLGACFEYFGPMGRSTERLFKLLDSGVDETWFQDLRYRDLYLGLFQVVTCIGQEGVTVRIQGILDAAEKRTPEKGWAREAMTSCIEASGYFVFSDLLESEIPLWWQKLKRPKLVSLLGTIDQQLTTLPPSTERVATVESLIGQVTEQWQAEPAVRHSELGLLERTRTKALAPRPLDSRISTGLLTLDQVLGGGLSGPSAPDSGRLIVVCARPAMGKALRRSEPVLLANGTWKPIGDLTVGEQVASRDGEPSTVMGVFPQGQKQLYRIQFSDGRSVDCCREHLWTVNCPRWDNPAGRSYNATRTIQTWELARYMESKRYQRRITIDTVQGEFGSPVQSIVHPWLLGALIGDGCLSTHTVIAFSSADKDMVDRCSALAPAGVNLVQRGESIDWGMVTDRGLPNPLLDALRELGLMGKKADTKSVPKQYLKGTREERLELLRGLMDADGGVENNGGTALFCTVSEQLALDVQYLVRSLGGWSTVREKQTHFTYQGERKPGQLSYLVNVNIPDNPFWLPRKAEAMKPDRFCRRPTVLSVQAIDADDATCIAVSHPSQLFVTRDFIVTHNTQVAVNLAMRVAASGNGVAFWSLEMQDEQIALRMLAAWDYATTHASGGVRIGGPLTYAMLRSHEIHGPARERLASESYAALDQNLTVFNGGSSLTPQTLCHQMRLFCRRRPDTRLFVIDHLGLLDVGDNGNRAVAVGEATRLIKTTAVSLGVDVALLAQLNRGVEKSADKIPSMADLRDSGRIEEDADVILGLHRPAYYNAADPSLTGRLDIIVLKNRQGSSGTFLTRIDLDCCAVSDDPSFLAQVGA